MKKNILLLLIITLSIFFILSCADVGTTPNIEGELEATSDDSGTDDTTAPDTTAPLVDGTSLSPASDSTGIAVDTVISVKFIEAGGIDESSLTAASITLKDNDGTDIAFTPSYNASELELMLTPDSDLEEAESYTVTLSADIKDIAGNSISSSFSWSFSTTVPAVFFSEYVEGSNNNKALEIYNGSGSDIDQSKMNIYFYTNGSATATGPVAIASGTLAAGDVWVIGNSAFSDPSLLDQASSAVTFNGNDAVELTYNGITVDVIGQIGNDPGSAWASGGVSTESQTLRRKLPVTIGDTNGTDAFDPSVEWDSFAQDTFDGLGEYITSMSVE